MKTPTQHFPDPGDVELLQWVRQLQEAQTKLRERLGDSVDAVLGPGGQTILLQEAQARLLKSEAEAHDSLAQLRTVQEMLSSSLRMVQRFMDNSLDVICVCDRENRFVRISAASEKVFGYKPEEMLGRNAMDFILYADRPRSQAAADRIINGEPVRDFQNHIRRKDGSVARVMWSAVWSEPDQLVFCIARDVTDDFQASELLRQSESMLREAQRIARLGSWESDLIDVRYLELNPLRWSDEVFRIFGYEPGGIAVNGPNFFKAVHPADRDAVRVAALTAIRGGGHYAIDHRIILPGGEIRWVHEEAQVSRDGETGRPLKMVGFVQDITEQKERAEALRISEARFTGAFEHATIGMALVGLDGGWLRVNSALCELLGYEEKEFFGKTFQEITYPDDLEADLNLVREVLEDRIQHYQMEKRYLHKQGHVIWAQLSVSLVRDTAGQPLYFVSQIQDITARREGEIRLKRLNRLYTVLYRIGETIVRERDEKRLCQEACRIAVEQGEVRMAWIGKVDPKTKEIIPFVSAGVDEGYLKQLKVSAAEGPGGDGPAGRAVRAKHPVLCNDIETDQENILPWREDALRRGYRSIAALPLHFGPDRDGVIVFYAPEPSFFNQEEVALLISMSENISFALDSLRQERDRLKMEETLRQSEEHYRLLFYDNPHPMWVYDIETLRILAVNTVAQLHYGYTEEEFLAMTLRDLRPPEELARFDEMLGQLPPGKNTFASRHRCKTGQIIDVEISSDAILFQGRAARLVAVTDVTERKGFEQRLAEQAALLDEARDAIIVGSLDQHILFWNKGAERLYGRTAREAFGRAIADILQPNPERFATALDTVLRRGAWHGDLEQVNRQGQAVVVESRWTLLRDADGQPRGVLSINTDVTERRKLESHVLRTQRMESIGTLASGIAHDLNNLLSPIIMGVDLLKHFGLEGASRKVVEDIERSAKRGSNLVKQVLSFARGMEGPLVSLQVRDIIDEITSIVHNTFPKDITLEVDITKGVLLLKGDATQLNQVFLNLCVNARDAMPQGGRITIAVERVDIDAANEGRARDIASGPYLCISVSDTGCGIPQGNLDKIFDPFFTTKELSKGTGLGLATSLGIVRSHGGFINVTSEVGKGSTFKVYLPAEVTPATAASQEEDSTERPRGNGECILLIDDETSILAVTQRTLEAYGYRVIIAEHGRQAVELFRAHRDEIVLVLTDMMMPVMDGAATIQALQEIQPRLRFIAASGLNSSSGMAHAALRGVRHFLSKPYGTGNLLITIRKALSEQSG